MTFCPYDGTRLLGGDEPDSLVGREIDGRFTITSLLGKGGMGAVYLATQHPMEREVALKVLKPELSKTVEVKKRFLREAKSSSRLSNPHTVSVYDFGQTDDGMLYLAMERLVGETLGALLKRTGALPEARAQSIAQQLCESLAEAHAQNLVHRDVKPENVFLLNPGTTREFVKVLDFGIAKSVGNSEETALTGTGMVCGTPEYMSPEHASGRGATPASDVYSVGVLLYQALTGVTPFAAESPMQVLIRQIQEAPPPLRDRMGGRELSVSMQALVERCLSKDPAERPADADALLAELSSLDEARAAAHRARTVEHASAEPLPRPSDERPTLAGAPGPEAGFPASGAVLPDDDAPPTATADLLRAVRPTHWPWIIGLGALALAALLALWHFGGEPPPAPPSPAPASPVEPAPATPQVQATPPIPRPVEPPAPAPGAVVEAPGAATPEAPAATASAPTPEAPAATANAPTPKAPSKPAPAAPPAAAKKASTPATAGPPRLRELVVTSEPAGATVSIDGDLRGTTPADVTARVGARLLVRKPGYREHASTVEAGGPSRLRVVLEPTDEAAIRKALEDGLK